MKDKEEIIEHLKYIAEQVDIEIDEFIIFGSTAKGERTQNSDTDIIVLSSDYTEELTYNRTPTFLEEWNFDEFGPVDFICLTHDEFNERKKQKHTVYEEANNEGINVRIEDK